MNTYRITPLITNGKSYRPEPGVEPTLVESHTPRGAAEAFCRREYEGTPRVMWEAQSGVWLCGSVVNGIVDEGGYVLVEKVS